MLINCNNFEDVKKYFQGTFVKVQEYNDQLFYVKGVDPGYVYLESTDKQIDFRIDLSQDYNLNYIIPRKTVYQYGYKAACLARIPARQWKKGMCKNNTQILLLGGNGWQPIDFDMETIEKFVNKPAYLTWEQIKGEFVNGTLISAALSPRFSVLENGSIYLDTTIVGKLNLEKNILTTRKAFEADISVFFPSFTKKVLK